MNSEKYTPGYSQTSRSFMARRRVESHASFILPYIESGNQILDCGCGPGTITQGLAERFPDSNIYGIDSSEMQIKEAVENNSDLFNLKFNVGSVYRLPFSENSFDFIFAHALFEHISDPIAALLEMRRTLRPGGFIGICSPDFEGFVISPFNSAIQEAMNYYRTMQEKNGGNTLAGRYLHNWISQTGFTPVKTLGRCENYPSPEVIGEYLAQQLDEAAQGHALTFREWMSQPAAMFSQVWISCVARL